MGQATRGARPGGAVRRRSRAVRPRPPGADAPPDAPAPGVVSRGRARARGGQRLAAAALGVGRGTRRAARAAAPPAGRRRAGSAPTTRGDAGHPARGPGLRRRRRAGARWPPGGPAAAPVAGRWGSARRVRCARRPRRRRAPARGCRATWRALAHGPGDHRAVKIVGLGATGAGRRGARRPAAARRRARPSPPLSAAPWSPGPPTWPTCSTCAPGARSRSRVLPPRPLLVAPSGGARPAALPRRRSAPRSALLPGDLARHRHARRHRRQRRRRPRRLRAARAHRPLRGRVAALAVLAALTLASEKVSFTAGHRGDPGPARARRAGSPAGPMSGGRDAGQRPARAPGRRRDRRSGRHDRRAHPARPGAGFARWFVFSGAVGATCVGSVYQRANALPERAVRGRGRRRARRGRRAPHRQAR